MNVRGTLISFRGGTVRNHSMYCDVFMITKKKKKKKRKKKERKDKNIAAFCLYSIIRNLRTHVCTIKEFYAKNKMEKVLINNANKLYERRAGNCVTWVHNF